MSHWQFMARGRIRVPRLLLLALALSLVAVGATVTSPMRVLATAEDVVDQEKYLGRWNYDQPDRDSMRNIAAISCPVSKPGCPSGGISLQIPNIGDIVFSKDVGGGVVGRTDQGCVWTFAVHSSSLELDPAVQYCRNPISNLAYTITSWSVTVSGRQERETIVASSHHGNVDYDFVLKNEGRTKVFDGEWNDPTPFAGNWKYDPADARSSVNFRVTRNPDGRTETVEQRGSVAITKDHGNRITAQTGDGCTWSLLVRGNTAKLDLAVQNCSNSAVALKFWTIASDGQQQTSFMTGVDEQGGNFAVGNGSLTRH